MVTKSTILRQKFPLRKKAIPQMWGQIAGGENFPGIGRDEEFIKQLMPQLQGHTLVMLAGHGYPGEIVGGPIWKNFEGLNFEGAVVLNIACSHRSLVRRRSCEWCQARTHDSTR
jgi:hypothetical protein